MFAADQQPFVLDFTIKAKKLDEVDEESNSSSMYEDSKSAEHDKEA